MIGSCYCVSYGWSPREPGPGVTSQQSHQPIVRSFSLTQCRLTHTLAILIHSITHLAQLACTGDGTPVELNTASNTVDTVAEDTMTTAVSDVDGNPVLINSGEFLGLSLSDL